MSFKGNEKFVAESLQSYFEQHFEKVSFEEQESDPPDIYLHIGNKHYAVEITDIDQNVLKNRKTIDFGYLKFIDNLEKEFNHIVIAIKRFFCFFTITIKKLVR
ncbi:hypothetical protein [Aliarcobacter cryaerophilus]|uniref:hypothetical protein n=1 Tax=Aliarcobacter cryaerophilus TaxID=28198 RepID=UPI003DA67FBE